MNKRFFAFIGLLLLLCFGPTPGRAGEAADLTLRTDGARFVDGAGREVILRGVNAGGRSKLPPFYPFDPQPDFETALHRYADGVAALGFNVVRLLILYEAAEPERGKYNEDYLRRYDQMVGAFSRRGIRVIVDAHQDLFSRRYCGDGFPDWALAEADRELPTHADCQGWSLLYFRDPVTGALDRFWSNADGVRDRYVAFFGMLAERYRHEPAVIGFEPMNEPFPGRQGLLHYSAWNRDRLFELYRLAGEAVHAVDERYLIFADLCPLENQGAWNPATRPRPAVANLVLAPHYYDPGTFGLSISPGGDEWLMRRGLNRDAQLGRAWNAPVLLTEYGISPLFPDAPAYINKLYNAFDALLLSGTFWEASQSATVWNLENTSIFEPDGPLRPGAGALDRPYPRAAAGRIETFSFQVLTGRVEMTWTEDPQITAPTELYLPRSIYPREPRIELEAPAEFRFDPESRVLFIPPRAGAIARKLMVQP